MTSLIFVLILVLNLENDPSKSIENIELSNIEQVKVVQSKPDVVHSDNKRDSSDDRDDDDVGSKYGIPFIRKMYNEESKEMTYCDPNKYKYIEILLKDLEKSNLDSYRTKTRSMDIENDYLQWKTSCWVTKKDGCWFWKKKMRVQIIDSQIYVSSTMYEMEEHIYDKEGYRIGLFFYLSELQRKYSKYLPNTDFILFYHDIKKGGGKMEDRYNWKYNGRIPYFFTDYNLAHLSTDNLLLMTISRAYIKYKYFAEKKKAQKQMANQYNFQRIADYVYWLDLYKVALEALLECHSIRL